MRVYLDTSIVFRKLLRDPHPIKSWGRWDEAYASAIWKVEALRTIHRLRLEGRISDQNVVTLQQDIALVDEALFIVPVTEDIMIRASEPFPTVTGTLDAMHLASALSIHTTTPIDRFLTHDKQQATAAKSLGFRVDGV